jgi:DNA-binding transcriptional LysR family regulator
MEYTNLPDLDGWAALRAVVERGGVSEAATVLHVGQPAVTKRLRALEQCYGVNLLERVGGRLRLTPAGEKVYLLAVQTLDRQFSLCQELESLAKGKTTLRLEVTFDIGERLLPDLLLSFTDTYPDYKIESRLAYSRQIQTDLATGHIDVGLLEIAPDHPDILVQKWQSDELWLVCGTQHPLCGSDLLPLETLLEQKFVLREPNSSIRESLDAVLRGIGISKLNTVMEVGSSEAIIDMLAHGKHLSFLPRFAVAERVREGSLYHLKVSGFRILRTLWIARNRDALDHPVAEAFINLIRDKTFG